MQQEPAQTQYAFTCNLLKDSPKKFYQAVFIVAAGYLFFYFTFGLVFGLIALILMITSLPELFFPFKYILLTDKIVVNRFFYKVSHDYSYYKKVYDDKNGIFLSPYRFKTRMESFRGILIRLPENKKAEVIAFLKHKIETTEERINL